MIETKQKLDRLLERYCVQPVGNGYIDCICPREQAERFLEELQVIGILPSAYSLWQYMESLEEVHYGMGGPRSRYRKGWYSELNAELRTFENFREMDRFLDGEERRLQCVLAPGFWLIVPETWQYLPKNEPGVWKV